MGTEAAAAAEEDWDEVLGPAEDRDILVCAAAD